MVDKILNSIKSIMILNQEEEESFTNILTFMNVDKKELLYREGSVSDKYYFVHSGCLRVFSNNDGIENTIQFFFENSWYIPFSNENLQAIEPCVVVQISKYRLEDFFTKYPITRKIGMAFYKQGVECSHTRNMKLINLSPKELYEDLLKNFPEIVKRIPQKHIASYLRIKPESLSRLKKRFFSD